MKGFLLRFQWRPSSSKPHALNRSDLDIILANLSVILAAWLLSCALDVPSLLAALLGPLPASWLCLTCT